MQQQQLFGCISRIPFRKFSLLIISSLFLTFGYSNETKAIPDQSPLFLKNPVVPIMMLNMSRDHQLFFKVYDDYSDITDPSGGEPDGIPDRTFNVKYDYYGYFDSGKCYKYNTSNNRFEPSRISDPSNKSYCNYSGGSGEWSGNFLNWASMTRMDAIRKILYGGYRSTDTNTDTVLERAFLPHDAHSFAKFYDGNDIDKLTPFSVPELVSNTTATGITICNTTAGTGYSQSVTAAPLIRVAKGNYTFWASNERWQCRWDGATNGNNATASGINAYTAAPASTSSNKLGSGSAAGEYYVRIQVCKSATGVSPEDNCQQYPSATYANKPTGLLQTYGETSQLNFGLITGTYGKNKSGGVLRKNVGNMLNEIDTTTFGTFKSAPTGGGIINTLNLFRLHGYAYSGTDDDGSYVIASPGGACTYGLSSFTEGACSNWGNPQSEIYYESLRYLAGATPTAAFSNSNSTTDAGYITGLTQASWSPPLTSSNVCAPLSVLQFNASSNSYDVGSSGYSNLGATGLGSSAALDSATNQVGNLELVTGTSRFVGMLTSATLGSAPNGNQLCTAKTIDSLSNVSGTCPDSPRLDGGYNIVGLARHARKTGIPIAGLNVTKTVRTYGVALAPALPKVEVPVPNASTGQKVIIQPACRNNSTTPSTNCAIVDFKIVSQRDGVDLSGYPTSYGVNGTKGTVGKLYVNWEDSEQGGDYDQDMWGVIDYIVTATKVVVSTQVLAQSTPNSMGFGYVLTGTNSDGFNVHSGINEFLYGTTCTSGNGNMCTCRPKTNNDPDADNFGACNLGTVSAARSKVFNVASSSAQFLESPLYYAAKWGGYDQGFAIANAANLDEAIKNRDPSDTYYFATDPKDLANKIKDAFNSIANDLGASASVATTSSYISEGSYVYQTKFMSQVWTGVLEAFQFDSNGKLSLAISTKDAMPKNSSTRTLYTYNGSSLVNLSWTNLTATQKTSLGAVSSSSSSSSSSSPSIAERRVDWLQGNSTYETTVAGGTLRDRGVGAARNILGDLVNSSPVYVDSYDHRYNVLPGTAGSTYAAYLKTKKDKKSPRIFVGANDGMLHAFDAKTLKELFAYIPNAAFPKLAKLTAADYGKSSNPHQYVVDGPIAVGDVYIGGLWKTILVGTLGAGGRGVYALDITDSAPKILFELTEANYPQLGYVLGAPQIVPMVNDRWAVIFGNGDSSSATSHLFVVDIEAPLNAAYTKVINTGSGIGLSTVALLTDAYGRATKAYAGDLSGNMWRFDLSASALLLTNPSATATQIASTWAKDRLIFVAKDSANNVQPIFAAPVLGLNEEKNNSMMVYFGTGKYYDAGDNVATATPRYSMYAVADTGSTTTVSKTTLLKKALNSSGVFDRRVKEANPNWTTQNGWYIDFDTVNGERVTTTPILIADKLLFATLIPSASPCDFGGTSWVMEVVAVGNKFVNQHVLDKDVNLEALVLGEFAYATTGKSDPTDPTKPKPEPDDPCKDSTGTLIGSDSRGDLLNQCIDLPDFYGRQSWRQLR